VKAKPPKRCGPKGQKPSSLPREDMVILMPEREFEAWATKHFEAAKGDQAAERRARQEIEADRRLRVWAREEGRRIRDEQRTHVEAPPRGGLSESVLEEALLGAFLQTSHFERVRVPAGVVVAHGPLGVLLQQLRVATDIREYRLDFALMDPAADLFVCIEVDGHQFHERTPEQAQRDRERDRKLTAAGWMVLRYTGREVFRSAKACAAEVIAIAHSSRRRVG
jgi:very-short-patch-repair endonuclease